MFFSVVGLWGVGGAGVAGWGGWWGGGGGFTTFLPTGTLNPNPRAQNLKYVHGCMGATIKTLSPKP